MKAFNADLEAGQLLEYFVETTRNLGLLDNLQNFKEQEVNETNYFQKNTNNIGTTFPTEKFRFKNNENKFDIMDVLKTMRDQKDTNKSPIEFNNGFKISSKEVADENFEELGRQLMDEG